MSKLSDYKVESLTTKATIDGQKITSYNFKRKDGKKIQRKDMIAISNKIRESYQKKHEEGVMEVSIKYPKRWYSADASFLTEMINFFNMNDYEEFDKDPEEYAEFRIYFVPLVHHEEGGADLNNDCLVKCIKN